MNEIWKSVVGWEGLYEVSDQGSVRSLDRQCVTKSGVLKYTRGRILKQSLHTEGYWLVDLSIKGTKYTHRVHRLVGHAFIDSAWFGEFDHIDTHRYNSKASNLRKATRQQNSANARKRRTKSSSKFKGVSFCKRTQSWESYICPDNNKIHLGRFLTQEQAAQAYNTAAIKYFKEFARINEI